MRTTQAKMRAVAVEERTELGLSATAPFDPYALAAEHGIEVYTLDSLGVWEVSSAAIDHFASSPAWSAALVPLGAARIIVENQAHAPVRRRSNIAHELGHHLLEHPFDQVILGEDHKRQFNKQQEAEANFMAGELLIPLAAAEQMAYRNWTNAQVASAYTVSEQFAQNQMKGQRVRARRAAAKYGYQVPTTTG